MKSRIFLIACLLLGSLTGSAYDFEYNGLLYRITNRLKRTVEVTHWDEFTGTNGVPDHYRPDACLAHMHDSTHVHDESCGHLHEEEHIPVIPSFPDTIVIPSKVWYRGIRYKVTAVGDGSFFGRENLAADGNAYRTVCVQPLFAIELCRMVARCRYDRRIRFLHG